VNTKRPVFPDECFIYRTMQLQAERTANK